MPSSTAQQNFLRELIFLRSIDDPLQLNRSDENRNFKERLNLDALKHSAIQAARRKDQMRPIRSGAYRPISLDAIHAGNVFCNA